jgi:hypothetical protein
MTLLPYFFMEDDARFRQLQDMDALQPSLPGLDEDAIEEIAGHEDQVDMVASSGDSGREGEKEEQVRSSSSFIKFFHR